MPEGKAVEDVRVCRFCGHITPVDSTARCRTCGVFSDFIVVPRPAAERLGRQRQRRVLRRRLVRLTVALALVGGVILWVLGAFFDLGPHPPRATTHLSAHLGPQTWAQSRRTPHSNGFTPEAAPLPHHVAWTYHTSQPLLAAPAVVAPHVYLSTGDGRLVALEQETGQAVWEYRSGWLSSSTPAVADDLVIYAVRPGLVIALHRQTGQQHWQTHLHSPILASPVVVQGTVYIGTADKTLYALDVATGRQRWVFTTQDWIVSAVAYAGDRVIVTSQDSRLYVVSAATGRQRLVYETGLGVHISAGPAVDGERAYFGSVRARVWAINWQATTYPLERALLFWKNNLYLWGVLAELPVQKGSVWSRRVAGNVRHTPAIAHNTVYVATARQQVVALEAATGSEQWHTDVGVEITAAPTVADTTVLIGTKDGAVVGLQARTGAVLWQFKTAAQITGSPIVAGDTMYVVSHDGTLYAVRAADVQ
jgi:outer membrane protein assembly factor BamB